MRQKTFVMWINKRNTKCKKNHEREWKKKDFLNAVYTNPVVWNTNKSNLNAYCMHLLNCECCVCLYSISADEMYCILAKKKFLFLVPFRWANNAGLLPETMISHSLYTIHYTPYHQLWTSWKTATTIIICDVFAMHSKWSDSMKVFFFFGVTFQYLEHMRYAYGSGWKYVQEWKARIQRFNKIHQI